MSSEPITVHFVRDSAMADKEAYECPETGWGMPFADRFDGAVTVANHARNGRSIRTFLEEGRWRPVARRLTETDYVFVQLGHNDGVPSKKQHTTEAAFVDNLWEFVGETREQGATPVFLTPIARRQFDDDGVPKDTHRVYADLTRTVALDRNAPLIDMDERTRALSAELGPDASTALCNHLEPGEHSNYPERTADDTHFSEHGARRMADVVLGGIAELDLGLAIHVES